MFLETRTRSEETSMVRSKFLAALAAIAALATVSTTASADDTAFYRG
jgi:uncharacterized membrane protein